MACCGESKGDETNDAINKDIRADKKAAENHIKILLLGTGESGKSTVAKQMKLLHQDGFNSEERNHVKIIINNNIIHVAQQLVEGVKTLGLKFSGSAKKAATYISSLELATSESSIFQEDTISNIKILWADKNIQEAYEKRSQFQILDSASYFMDKLDSFNDTFVPSDDDVLRARSKTTGIIETSFSTGGKEFSLIDVGGQRSERKKWMNCFEDVDAVIFCVALSEYDLTCYEDEETNRLEESLSVFDDTLKQSWLEKPALVLFLNKKDLFAEKIKKVDIAKFHPTYKGGLDYDEGLEYISGRYTEISSQYNKETYIHPTCATDKDSVKAVFSAIESEVFDRLIEQFI